MATDVDGVKEIITDGKTGILVPPKNPEKLAEALLQLIKNKDLANLLGAALKEDIQKRCSLLSMVESVQDLYLRLFRGKNKLH